MAYSYDHVWTPEDIEKLRELWFSGMTGTECSKHFKVSRSSILGRVHRCGWTAQRRQIHPVTPRRERPDRPEKPVPVIPTRPFQPFTVTIQNLTPGMCRWPSPGDVAPWTFCGVPKLEGSSYCPEHHKRAHYKGSTYVVEKTIDPKKAYHFGSRVDRS